MSTFKTTFCLALLTLSSSPALAHETPLPHDHGMESGLIFLATTIIAIAASATFIWRRYKRSAN